MQHSLCVYRAHHCDVTSAFETSKPQFSMESPQGLEQNAPVFRIQALGFKIKSQALTLPPNLTHHQCQRRAEVLGKPRWNHHQSPQVAHRPSSAPLKNQMQCYDLHELRVAYLAAFPHLNVYSCLHFRQQTCGVPLSRTSTEISRPHHSTVGLWVIK